MPQLARLLRAHKLSSPFSQPHDHLVSIRDSKPMSHRRSRELYEKACASANIKFPLHDLRDTFASHLILDLKLDVVQVSRQLGHSSPSVTLDVYAHLFDQARHADETRQAMAESEFGRLLGQF
jgi:integrase